MAETLKRNNTHQPCMLECLWLAQEAQGGGDLKSGKQNV
jgi:hypothetical protein